MPERVGTAADTAEPSPTQERPEAAIRDHLANERTLLAWQRTALAVVAIGFLVDRFAIETGGAIIHASVAGLGMVVLGGVVSAVGAFRFMRTEREIDTQSYRPAVLAHLALTGAVVVACALVLIVLLSSPQ
jgi:inner membrane protein YidH